MFHLIWFKKTKQNKKIHYENSKIINFKKPCPTEFLLCKKASEKHSTKDTANIIRTSLLAFLLIIFINIHYALQLKCCVPELPWQHNFHRTINSSSSKAARKAVFGRFVGWLVEIGQKSRGKKKTSFHCLENAEINTMRDFCISRVASEECKFWLPSPKLSSRSPNSRKQSW